MFSYCVVLLLMFNSLILGQGFGGLSKVFVACHCSSKTLVVVKQTNVDVQNAEHLEELKVCAYEFWFNVCC